MKNRIFSLLLFIVASSMLVKADDSSMRYLKQQCPQLTDMYQEELKNCHAHYLFVVDVSGSMCKYEELVRPALEAFIKAAPIGDKVTIIPFAREAKGNELGFSSELTLSTRSSMAGVMSSLYPTKAEARKPMYQYTNIYAAQQEVSKAILKDAQYDVNIVVFISDLLHCPDDNGNPNNDRQFSATEMNDMRTKIKTAKHEHAEYLVFTLELPKAGSEKGYIYDQLQELYDEWGVKVKQQRVRGGDEALIRQWFEKQKNDIMFMKLQSIIMRENRANPIVVKTKIDIDGNVTAHIEWRATKLYPKITLDTTYIANSDFRFVANEKYVHYNEAGEINADLDLGQIKHKNWGFHKLADTLHFDVNLPVEYQSEITKLLDGQPKPLANTTEYVERTIFTFMMPLWLTITFIILIILYIIGVIKAMMRNGQLRFQGNVLVYDMTGEQIGDMRRIAPQKPSAVIVFGAGANLTQTKVDDADWSFEVRKKKGNPLLLFQKPKFVWQCKKGYCAVNKRQSGDIITQARIQCGVSRTEQTHSVVIKIMSK